MSLDGFILYLLAMLKVWLIFAVPVAIIILVVVNRVSREVWRDYDDR